MEILGLIPARGDSKGIPGKNLAPVLGKPLIVWTCEAAERSTRLSRTIVNTDSRAIEEVCRKHGIASPFPRPPELGQDHTPILAVLQHVLTELERTENYRPDAILLLQPTSPLRTAEHIDNAIELMERSGADSVVSVIPVPHRFSPDSLMKRSGETLIPVLSGPSSARRQDKEPLYARNGPAIVLTKTELIKEGRLYGDNCRPFVMDKHSSVDIDDPDDLSYASFLLTQRQ